MGIDQKYREPFKVGRFGTFKINRWTGGGVISKEDSVRLAKAIIKAYPEEF